MTMLLQYLAAITWALIWTPIFWLLRTLISQFLLIFLITITWRAYKIFWPHVKLPNSFKKLPFVIGPQLRPIEAEKVILITGATSGIGLALAKYLYKRGYSVLATYYNAHEPGFDELKKLADVSMAKKNQNQQVTSSTSSNDSSFATNLLHLIELDVRSEESIKRAYEICTEWLDANEGFELYALVNNAGLGSLQPFAWLQRQTITNLIETNLLGNLRMTREFLPLLLKSRGRLIFVSSGLGLVPGATYATYGITKQAQIYLVNCLNMELKQLYGVQSIAVIPHNFIKNTNICAQNVANNEIAWQELKPVERDYYAREFEEHFKLAQKLELATKELRRQQQLTSSLPIGQNNNNRRNQAVGSKQQHQFSSLTKKVYNFLTQTIACLSGQNNALTLEESGCLECFEDALRLENPPEQMFAGDSIFQLIVGSLLLSLPITCIGILGPTVKPSLYK